MILLSWDTEKYISLVRPVGQLIFDTAAEGTDVDYAVVVAIQENDYPEEYAPTMWGVWEGDATRALDSFRKLHSMSPKHVISMLLHGDEILLGEYQVLDTLYSKPIGLLDPKEFTPELLPGHYL